MGTDVGMNLPGWVQVYLPYSRDPHRLGTVSMPPCQHLVQTHKTDISVRKHTGINPKYATQQTHENVNRFRHITMVTYQTYHPCCFWILGLVPQIPLISSPVTWHQPGQIYAPLTPDLQTTLTHHCHVMAVWRVRCWWLIGWAGRGQRSEMGGFLHSW